MSIGVHVLGPGYGESVVLELPDGRFGVIDGFRGPFGKPAVAEFLESAFRPDGLLFLAVTHPHADHCGGFGDLLGRYRVEELWAFDAIQFQGLCDYYHALLAAGASDPVEADLCAPPGAMLRELLLIRRDISERRRGPIKRKVRLLRSKDAFSLCDGRVLVRCLTPGSGATVDYRERLVAGLGHAAGATAEVRAGTAVAPDQNRASAALLFEYDRTRLLFLADAETPLWNEWEGERAEDPGLDVRDVRFIKAAHHGSANGYWRALYESGCGAEPPIVVVTPFTRSRSPLPTPDGVDSLAGHASLLVCTNRGAAQRSSSRAWDAAAADPGLPPEWLAAIVADRRLRALLVPPYGTDPASTDVPAVPAAWVRDSRRDPRLLALLRPGAGAAPAMSTPADFHRVSFYFNEDGTEQVDRRFLGPGTGILATGRAEDVRRRTGTAAIVEGADR